MSPDVATTGGPSRMTGARIAPPALELHDVTKRYPGTVALSSVSFTLKRFGILGLVGENGAGKSTLLSIINGTVKPDQGSIAINGEKVDFGHPSDAARHGIATVFQEQGLIPTIPVYENIFLGRERKYTAAGFLRRGTMISIAREVLDELEVDVIPTAMTGRLSFGQRQLVEIAKAFALGRLYPVEPIILLDEPTSALSDKEADKLFEGIRRWRSKGSFVLVSHRLGDIFQMCNEVVALKDGSVVLQKPVSQVNEHNLHQAIVGRERDAEYYREALQTEPLSHVVVSVAEIMKAGHLRGVSFDVRAGEIVGVAGVLGSGKSTLAKIVAGSEAQDSGTVTIAGKPLKAGSRAEAVRCGVGYVPAERTSAGIIGTDTIENNLTLTNLTQISRWFAAFISPSRSRAMTNDWMSRLRIRATGPSNLCRTLSGGNQQKVVFAKWLARGIDVLVCDDPGRGLDVGAKEDIYQLLRDLSRGGTAIMLVSDNLPELIGLSNRIIVMREGRCSAVIDAPRDAKPGELSILPVML